MKSVQTTLFDWHAIQSAHLAAMDHPRPVYYSIWLEGLRGSYRVRKESGVEGQKPNRREWKFLTRAAAEKEYDRKIKSKTNSNRKSPRKYIRTGAEVKPPSQRVEREKVSL